MWAAKMTRSSTKQKAARKAVINHKRARSALPRALGSLGTPPSGMAGVNYSGTPVQKHGSVTTTISGCDMVGDIFADQVWNVTEPFRVNPGDSALFPRLHAIAMVFEKYRFKKLRFLYFPITAATRSGAVVLAFETDVRDPSFETKEEMLNHYNSRRCSPWNPLVLEVAQKDLHPRPQMFVRPETTTLEDARLDDLGRLFIGTTVDSSSTISVGELWVEYEVELISPSVHGAVETSILYAESDTVDRTDPTEYASSLSLQANSTWDDFISWVDGSGVRRYGSLGPAVAKAQLMIPNLAGTSTTWSSTPSIVASNGATLRNSLLEGDRNGFRDGDGGYGYFENVMSLPGTIIEAGSDLLTLPSVALGFGSLTSGTVSAAALRFFLSTSGLDSIKPPPASVLQNRSRTLRNLSRGAFTSGGQDVAIYRHHKGKPSVFLTGRGLVPYHPPLRALLPSSPNPTPGEVGSTCAKSSEGACSMPGERTSKCL